MIEPKKCPFCGKRKLKVLEIKDADEKSLGFIIHAECCGYTFGQGGILNIVNFPYKTADEVIEAWNTRY